MTTKELLQAFATDKNFEIRGHKVKLVSVKKKENGWYSVEGESLRDGQPMFTTYPPLENEK